MPSNEKEINCNLFDQLSILERIEAVANEEAVMNYPAAELRGIERDAPLQIPYTQLFWLQYCPIEFLILFFLSLFPYIF